MKHKDQFAVMGRDVLLQAFFETQKMATKTLEGSPAFGAEVSRYIVAEAKKRGIPEPTWNGVAWTIPEN